ncbi:uncharacterized protein LOC136072550 [Hydra vulgaris]|uniref:uncharacterized protein LOC136072550 n=1 Tax=Hydra vulgaris TaxID=6087 RepID=UPI0032EA79A4
MELENNFEKNNFLIKPSSQVCYLTEILEKYGYKNDENKVDFAASIGKLDLIKILIQLNEKGTEKAIGYASEKGRLDVVQYLHSIGYIGTVYAINHAAGNGHLEVLKYLDSLGYKGTEKARKVTDTVKQVVAECDESNLIDPNVILRDKENLAVREVWERVSCDVTHVDSLLYLTSEVEVNGHMLPQHFLHLQHHRVDKNEEDKTTDDDYNQSLVKSPETNLKHVAI